MWLLNNRNLFLIELKTGMFKSKVVTHPVYGECVLFKLQMAFSLCPHVVGGVQFSSAQSLSCVQLWDPMDHSTPGISVHHQLPVFTQTHVHWVSEAIQPSHPLSSAFPLAFNLSQHQGFCQWVSSSHQVAKVLELQLQHQSFQWIFRTDFL